MILGFHYHIPAYENDGIIYTAGFLGLFLDSLSIHVEQLVLFMHSPTPKEVFMMDYSIKGKNVILVSMGPHSSVPTRLLNSKKIVKKILPFLQKLDLLLIRCPTPLLSVLSNIKNLEKTYLVVGDYQKSARDLRQPFLKKKVIQLWIAINKLQQDIAIRNALVFVNNHQIFTELLGRVARLHEIKTTTLTTNDFYYKADTCQANDINILYTGRLDLSKGLLEMIESLYQLRSSGINATLHFVGWEDKMTSIVTELLKRQASLLGIEGFVFFHGMKQVGPELNSYYRMADIYLIGSKQNEGFPRTIWEAFANCTPVIASAVGGIPLFLRDKVDVVLIKPGSVEAMTNALRLLIEDSNLRKFIIKNAYEVAKTNTLEYQASKMMNIIYGEYKFQLWNKLNRIVTYD